MQNFESIADEVVAQAEKSGYGFGTNNLTYYVNETIQRGVAKEDDFSKLLEMAKKKAKKVCPARSLDNFKTYSEGKGIVLNFRSLAFLENELGNKPKYDLEMGNTIADVIMEVFGGYIDFDKATLLDDMRANRLKQVIENQIKKVSEVDY